MNSNKIIPEFTKGLLKENPILGLMLGLCSALAVSTEVANAVGMGAAMTFVLLGANILISLLRRSIPAKIRLPVFIVVIASFTTIVDLLMNAYLPDLHQKLGIFIPLIVVNCIIIGRAEAFASKNGIFSSMVDALGMGCGYTLVLTLIATIREVLSNGTFFGIPLFGHFEPILIMLLPPGAFITIGLLMALVRARSDKA
ncbi:electron transport complex protein RnfE [Hydrogenispora ethanolica]|jgi:electron transport complex protein RnfE|uniref:Ion-translocating oxidoreductase complex subunit E n=1 Tax=Hydrogenispora ethanolica TaxID=1082276 RepID=A0A4R1S1Z7_HYDET|nr:electron transport complex subunit E [Hydrogenispora ethanolica]TCL73171.1 electron transport complex protein RnfE [Hydrogenispora ethanolica]